MRKELSFVMAALFLAAMVTVALYTVHTANAQGNATGGAAKNMTGSAMGAVKGAAGNAMGAVKGAAGNAMGAVKGAMGGK